MIWYMIWYIAVCNEHSYQLWSSTESMFCLWTHMTVQLTTNKWHNYACIYLPSFLPLWIGQEAHEAGMVCSFTIKHLTKTINIQSLGEEYLRQWFQKFVNVAYFLGLFFPNNLFKLWQCLGVANSCNYQMQRIEKTLINTHTTKQELTNNSFHNTREHQHVSSKEISLFTDASVCITATQLANPLGWLPNTGLTVLAHSNQKQKFSKEGFHSNNMILIANVNNYSFYWPWWRLEQT